MKIRIKKTCEDNIIKLRDCEAGELVRLADRSVCLVVDALGIVRDDFVDEGLAAVWLGNGKAEMCDSLSVDMISGKDYRRIVERVGKVVVEGDER